MTNKMKLVFFITTVVSALAIMLSTPFVIDIADRALLAATNTLSLHEAPTPTALVVLVIPGLYLVFRQRRHS
jgi:hypothetical protein